MRKIILTASVLSLGLTACGQQADETAELAQVEQAMAEGDAASVMKAEEAPAAPLATVGAAPPPVTAPDAVVETQPADEPQGRATMPDFTYSYDYRFEAPGSELGRLQDAHVAACDAMGDQQCRIANYSQDQTVLGGTSAALELYVASDKIRRLASQMSDIAREMGGDRVAANIVGTNMTQRFDQAQLQVTNNLAQKERLQAIIDDPRSTRDAKEEARQRLASLAPRFNQDQRQLDNVASEMGFTKMDVRYSSSSLFGPWLPYALIILLLAVIGGVIHRSRQGGPVAEPVPA